MSISKSTEQIKHSGFILGISAMFTDFDTWQSMLPHAHTPGLKAPYAKNVGMGLQQGLTLHTDQDSYVQWLEDAVGRLVIGRRHELETDTYVRQILPYTLIMFRDEDDTDQTAEIFSYQRGEGVGEARLAKSWSIGGGGHIDLVDVAYDMKSRINLAETIDGGFEREFSEEIEFRDGNGEVVEFVRGEVDFGVRALGFIRDDSDAVGQVHLGVVSILTVPKSWTATCREPELLTGERATAAVLLSRGLKFENWSQLILEELAQIGQLVPGDEVAALATETNFEQQSVDVTTAANEPQTGDEIFAEQPKA